MRLGVSWRIVRTFSPGSHLLAGVRTAVLLGRNLTVSERLALRVARRSRSIRAGGDRNLRQRADGHVRVLVPQTMSTCATTGGQSPGACSTAHKHVFNKHVFTNKHVFANKHVFTTNGHVFTNKHICTDSKHRCGAAAVNRGWLRCRCTSCIGLTAVRSFFTRANLDRDGGLYVAGSIRSVVGLSSS
jgi:hypothetical protein